jgi:hypothetical protein
MAKKGDDALENFESAESNATEKPLDDEDKECKTKKRRIEDRESRNQCQQVSGLQAADRDETRRGKTKATGMEGWGTMMTAAESLGPVQRCSRRAGGAPILPRPRSALRPINTGVH